MAVSPLSTSTELSVYDAVSRSLRWFRSDIKLFVRRLALVSFFYCADWHAIFWLGKSLESPYAVAAMVFALCLLVVVQFEFGSRMIASWRVFSGKETDFDKALARSRQPRVLLLFLPIILSDMLFAVVAVSTYVLTASGLTSDKVLALFLWLGILCVIWPQACLIIWTTFWAYVSEVENCSPWMALKKVFQLQSKAPYYTFGIFLFFGFALVTCEMPFQLFETMSMFIDQLPLPRSLTPVLKECFEITFATGSQIIMLSFQICGAAFIYRMLKMRFDGLDISEKLDQLQSRLAE
ncbi:MAG: hypothetical protein K2X77_16385 [Candidatus Obscuribacterales bacterium]|jgi:hypothetical protein|nr:hypothetical protein [Candidatus Obscuribacterales bacterium]